MILIGSRAAALNGFPIGRKPVDWDLVCFESEIDPWLDEHNVRTEKRYEQKGKVIVESPDGNCEFELIKENHSSLVLHLLATLDAMSNGGAVRTPFGIVPPLDLLFTIKQSHRYLKNSPHFYKTLCDWHRMRALGAKVRPEYEEFLKIREQETYNYKHPKLDQGKKTFFADDQISYKYDHDSLHVAIKQFDKPAYAFFKRDDAEVMTSRKKFDQCSREVQLYSAVEEAGVLALERSLIPHPGVLTPDEAWRLAFSKICTSIASGWWRQFNFENAFDIMKLYPTFDYVQRFQRGLEAGVVRLHEA